MVGKATTVAFLDIFFATSLRLRLARGTGQRGVGYQSCQIQHLELNYAATHRIVAIERFSPNSLWVFELQNIADHSEPRGRWFDNYKLKVNREVR